MRRLRAEEELLVEGLLLVAQVEVEVARLLRPGIGRSAGSPAWVGTGHPACTALLWGTRPGRWALLLGTEWLPRAPAKMGIGH